MNMNMNSNNNNSNNMYNMGMGMGMSVAANPPAPPVMASNPTIQAFEKAGLQVLEFYIVTLNN